MESGERPIVSRHAPSRSYDEQQLDIINKGAEFHRLFDFPPSEKLIEDFSCAYHKKVLRQGRLYVTQRHIAFHSVVGSKFWVDFGDIQKIEKKKSLGLFHNAIQITMKDQNIHFFSSFIFRDQAHKILCDLLCLYRRRSKRLSDAAIGENKQPEDPKPTDGNEEEEDEEEEEEEEESDNDSIRTRSSYEDDDEIQELNRTPPQDISAVGRNLGKPAAQGRRERSVSQPFTHYINEMSDEDHHEERKNSGNEGILSVNVDSEPAPEPESANTKPTPTTPPYGPLPTAVSHIPSINQSASSSSSGQSTITADISSPRQEPKDIKSSVQLPNESPPAEPITIAPSPATTDTPPSPSEPPPIEAMTSNSLEEAHSLLPPDANFTPIADLMKKPLRNDYKLTNINSLIKLYQKIIINSSDFYIQLHIKRGDKDTSHTSWTAHQLPNGQTWSGNRVLTCTSEVTKPRRAWTPVEEHQRFYYVSTPTGRMLVIHQSSKTPEVMYGDCFRVEIAYVFKEDEANNGLVIDSYGQVIFVKSTMMRRLIEGTAAPEILKVVDVTQELLTTYLSTSAAAPSASDVTDKVTAPASTTPGNVVAKKKNKDKVKDGQKGKTKPTATISASTPIQSNDKKDANSKCCTKAAFAIFFVYFIILLAIGYGSHKSFGSLMMFEEHRYVPVVLESNITNVNWQTMTDHQNAIIEHITLLTESLEKNIEIGVPSPNTECNMDRFAGIDLLIGKLKAIPNLNYEPLDNKKQPDEKEVKSALEDQSLESLIVKQLIHQQQMTQNKPINDLY